MSGILGTHPGQAQRGSIWPSHNSLTPPLTNMVGWYKANEIFINNNDPVSTWPDKSGLGNHATQSDAAIKPIYKTNVVNALPAVDFVDHALDVPGLYAALNNKTGASLFVVWKSRDDISPVPEYTFYMSTGASGTNSRLVIQKTNGTLAHAVVNRRLDADSATTISGAALGTMTSHIISSCVVDLAGNTVTLWKNGTQDATGSPSVGSNFSATNALRCVIGSQSAVTPARTLDGTIAEIIFYDTALSTANRQLAERYLGDKYAITVA